MNQTIKIKRGLEDDLPMLEEGEMGFCTDTKKVYIGDGAANTLINENISYMHNQLSASNEWIIQHNLNKYPNIAVVDSAGNVVVGEIKYISANEVQLNFNAPFSGKAYLN